MGTYWPVLAPNLVWGELPTSGRLAHHTQFFLVGKGYGTTTPIEYGQGVISHFAVKHRTRFPGLPVIVSGDFKRTFTGLQEWAVGDSWSIPLEPHLPPGLDFNTYWAQAAHKQAPDYAGT